MCTPGYDIKDYLTQRFLEWAYQQREFYLPNSRPLSGEERLRLAGYFDQSILDLTRVVGVARILNPEFYDGLTKFIIPIPLDFTQAMGFTLVDCVLIRNELHSSPSSWMATLFHEMVHVVQFDILGLTRMVELYTDYLLQSEYQYPDIPFEQQAYTLAERFAGGEPPFSVRETIEPELRRMI